MLAKSKMSPRQHVGAAHVHEPTLRERHATVVHVRTVVGLCITCVALLCAGTISEPGASLAPGARGGVARDTWRVRWP